MRYLLLSDVHANAVALTAVLHHARTKRWQQVLFLGDAVGYYTQPEEVITTLGTLPLAVALLGNHDAMLLDPDAGGAATGVVKDVLGKQRKTLSTASRTFLTGLVGRAEGDDWEAVHSTLSGSWDYVDSLERARSEPERMSRNLLFFGHTHIPVIYLFTEHQGQRLSRSVPLTKEASSYRLPPNARILVNPGSVGQPRDGVPLASYAVFDDETRVVEHFRVPFDIFAVQKQVVAAGYPPALALRLEQGR